VIDASYLSHSSACWGGPTDWANVSWQRAQGRLSLQVDTAVGENEATDQTTQQAPANNNSQ